MWLGSLCCVHVAERVSVHVARGVSSGPFLACFLLAPFACAAMAKQEVGDGDCSGMMVPADAPVSKTEDTYSNVDEVWADVEAQWTNAIASKKHPVVWFTDELSPDSVLMNFARSCMGVLEKAKPDFQQRLMESINKDASTARTPQSQAAQQLVPLFIAP